MALRSNMPCTLAERKFAWSYIGATRAVRTRHPGTCFVCGSHVAAGTGMTQFDREAKRWAVFCSLAA
jgi:hypothetical protein